MPVCSGTPVMRCAAQHSSYRHHASEEVPKYVARLAGVLTVLVAAVSHLCARADVGAIGAAAAAHCGLLVIHPRAFHGAQAILPRASGHWPPLLPRGRFVTLP